MRKSVAEQRLLQGDRRRWYHRGQRASIERGDNDAISRYIDNSAWKSF